MSLIIVGAGTAGLAAAATASELELSSVLIEKTDRVGGMLHWSSGHFSAAGTRRQARRGIEDHPDLHYADVMRLGHGENDPDLVRLAVDQAPHMADWLEDLGFPFSDETPALVTGHELYSQPRTLWGGDDPTRGGVKLLETLSSHVDSKTVQVLTKTRLSDLLIDGSGGTAQIKGVVVEGPNGREELEGETVILATGGYAANRDLVARLQTDHPEALTGCMDHASGDAHELLIKLGSEITHTDTYVPTMGMIENPTRPGFGLRLTYARMIVDPATRQPWEVWVNRMGRRFVAEDTASPFERERGLLAQPHLEMFVIWDQSVVDAAPPPVGPDWSWPTLIRRGSEEGWLQVEESLDELGSMLGMPSTELANELAAYNADDDDQFGRTHRPVAICEPPFYAVRVVGGMLLSRGGPAVDSQLQPLNGNGIAINGLYAVGELLGMGKFSGDSFAGGMSVGPALSLGRWLVNSLSHARY